MDKIIAKSSLYHNLLSEDHSLDKSLRPTTFKEFIGQKDVVGHLTIYIEAAKKRKEPVDHILLSGLPGLGKTTIANLVSKEMGTNMVSTSAPALEKPFNLVGILTNLARGDVLFIDEVHRLTPVIEEYLYSAMEDFTISMIAGQGPYARSVKLSIQPFTLIAATTREGKLGDPFRARFGVMEKLTFYPVDDLAIILKRSSKLLNTIIDDKACAIIAERSRGTPRVANRILKRIRDIAQCKSNNRITQDIAREGLEMLQIDDMGLDQTDRRIIELLISNHDEPVGLKTISASVGEEEETIEEIHEPYLIQKNLLIKTPRGRKVTENALKIFSRKKSDGILF
jgi:Holliday junction DNA helicase RuvB